MGAVLETLMSCDMGYSGVDAVVHLAAIPSPGQTNSSEQFRVNTMRWVRLAQRNPMMRGANEVLQQHVQRSGSVPQAQDYQRYPCFE